MSTSTPTRNLTVAERKIIAAIRQLPVDTLGHYKVGVLTKKFHSSMKAQDETFWTFVYRGFDEVRVTVMFNPQTKEFILYGEARIEGESRLEWAGEHSALVPFWQARETHFVPIDEIVENGLKQPLMKLLRITNSKRR